MNTKLITFIEKKKLINELRLIKKTKGCKGKEI